MWIFVRLNKQERAALHRLSKTKELPKGTVLRQAFRLYHGIDLRLSRGEQVFVPDLSIGCGCGE